MGLTIKGQCIPDVTEPMEGGREAGFSRRALGGSDRGGAERGAEQEAAPGAGQKADGRPQDSGPPGQGGPQLALGDLNIPAPGVASGARSPPPRGDVTCLKAVSPSAAWLRRRMDVAGACPSECLCVINVHSVCDSGRESKGRCTCLCTESFPRPLCIPGSDTSEWRCQSGLVVGVDRTSISECDKRGYPRVGLDSRVAEIQKA